MARSKDELDKRGMALLYILEMFEAYTDEDHPKTYRAVMEMLEDERGILMNRDTCSAKINLLIREGRLEDAGWKKGAYYPASARRFDDSELQLLLYSVLANRSIPQDEARDLMLRICDLGGPYFDDSVMKRIESLGRAKVSGNDELFRNLEELHGAMLNKRQIRFSYCRYGLDKKLHRSAIYTASPYHVTMKNQILYLAAYCEEKGELAFFRIDRMKEIETLRKKAFDPKKIPGRKDGTDFDRITGSLPYMFSDAHEVIRFRADASLTDDIVDWFGDDVRIERDPRDGSKLLCRIRTSPKAMEYWARQYLDQVEITEPQSLRESMLRSIMEGLEKYSADTGDDGRERRK